MDNVISNETLIKALEIYENKMLSSVDEREFETSEKFEKKEVKSWRIRNMIGLLGIQLPKKK